MLKRAPKLFLVATSLAPIFLTLAFLAGRAGSLWHAVGWLLLTLVLVETTQLLLVAAAHQLEGFDVKLASVKTSDREVIAFLLAYVLPLALTDVRGFSVDAYAVAFLAALFAIVIWGTHAYDFNPLLGLIGYHFFEVETQDGVTYVLITKRTIVSARQIAKVVQLTEYALLDRS